MATFDFISGEDFRNCLEADYQEMNLAMQVHAWKAVHVLAGSIIEALLVDALMSSNYKIDNLLSKQLGDLINLCSEKKLISEKIKQISFVLKSYRNLIHAGRLLRLGEVADEEGAKVAQALVNIVIKEVSNKKRENYGPTAEQILSKIENDTSTSAILPHLLKEINEFEKERLLIDIIPKSYIYFMNTNEPVGSTLISLSTCFRLVFETVSLETKKKVAKAFVKVIKEESEDIVYAYEIAFFRATDLQYFSSEEIQLVKQHLFSILSKRLNLSLLGTMEKIGNYLEKEDIPLLYEPLAKAYVSKFTDIAEDQISHFLWVELDYHYYELIESVKDFFSSLRSRYNFVGKHGLSEKISELEESVAIPYF